MKACEHVRVKMDVNVDVVVVVVVAVVVVDVEVVRQLDNDQTLWIAVHDGPGANAQVRGNSET